MYDLAMTHKLDADDVFIQRVQQQAAALGLSFFLVDPLWVEAFLERMERGEVGVRVLLNMHSEHHDASDVFTRLVWRAHKGGTRVIDPPDVALKAFDKALLHPVLEAAGLPVPYTVVVPREQAGAFRLGSEQSERLGRPFVVKPALGYGRKGVILDAQDERDLARSSGGWSTGSLLLQNRVQPGVVGTDPAYFRIFHVFGEIWPCWWNCFTDRYRVLTEDEERKHDLGELRRLVRELAKVTGMSFFSTEIARAQNGGYVLIDYVNDQCHMLTQSANPQIGVPDALVVNIARRLVDQAALMARGLG